MDFAQNMNRPRGLAGIRYLTAARAFIGAKREPLLDAVIEIADGLIVDIRTGGDDDPARRGASSDHFPGGTLLPGLVDAHCHISLAADQRSYEDMARDDDAMMALAAVRNVQRHLASGVTTVRDNGGRNDVPFVIREAAQRGYFESPRLLLAGRPLTPRGGHFHWCNGVADGPDAIMSAVRYLVSQGADHIKIMASGGGTAGLSPHFASFTVDELRVAVATAHAFDRLTTAHCRATESISRALDAGLDCIEHAEFLDRPARPMESARRPGISPAVSMNYDPAIGDRLASSGLYVSFTMQAGGLDTLVALRQQQSQDGLERDDSTLMSSLESYFDMKVRLLADLLQAGLRDRLVISSDAGPFDTQFGMMHHGLELAVLAGMTPAEAIESATLIASRALGIQETVGTLDVGKRADVLVVDGDPMADIRRLADVLAVYVDGAKVAATVTHVGSTIN